ncbi:SDR family NAD(P)-dependent oxidoreductase [Acuticoccus sediminis]|uniref:SDR family NAD(P)-dependent oxidoreductase n=1 Tax=Acuticoccus sediminis TaxID=2184697 RepID=UPI001CFEA4F4|nr:SDR family NAD(P)-dependent oxidoreductase [Acuticoccus sediminis]
MNDTTPTALIAGASRGLGLALAAELAARDWRVIATVRGDPPKVLLTLAAEHTDRVEIERLDITQADSIAGLAQRLDGRTLDLVLANAGITNRDVNAALTDVPDEEYSRMMLTNALGPCRLLEALERLVPRGGVLAAMSSILGSLGENRAGIWPAYASSKAALNMLLHGFHDRHGEGRAVIAMAPGWVRTDMGGPAADLSIAESIPRVADVLIGARGGRGLAYLNYDGRRVGW